MIKLRRFLKPFLPGLLIAVILLFIQAICELNLPNYMSEIVNVGIQQGGVEDSTPEALSQDGYTFITTFMDDDERAVMEQSYALASGAEKDAKGKPISDTYPKAAEEQIYVLRSDFSTDQRDKLDSVFGNATWTMVNVLKTVQAAQNDGTLEATITERVKQEMLGSIKQGLEDSGQPLPPGMTLDEMAEQVLEQQMAQQQAGDGSQGIAAQLGLGDIDPATLNDATGGDSDSADLQSLDFSKIYQFQPLLDLLPQQWFDDAHSQALNMDASLRQQSGTMLVAGFYSELGCDMTSIEIGYIVRIGLIMLLITALSGVATILVGYISSRIGAGVARDLRKSVFEKVEGFSHAEFDRFSTASLITRSTNDVAVIQMMLTMGIRMICYAPIMGIGGTFMALQKSVSMSWIIGVAVVVLIGIMLVLVAVVMPKFKIMQTLIDRLNLVAREALNGLMVVRAFSRSGFEKKRFDVANHDLTRVNLFVNRAMTMLMPVMMVFMNGVTLLIIWVGSHQVAQSQMQVGDMMAYMQYVMQIIMAFMFIAMMFIFIPRASVSAGRIGEVLETKPTVVDPVQPLHIDPVQRGRVEFRNVDFRYAGADHRAVSSISFVAQPGQTTAFIGSTGSGKSTIINLIPRFYDASAGEVLVGGVNVRDLTQHELRSTIGYIPQKNVLMAGTVASNIAYGADKLPTDELEKVTEVAQALEFVEKAEGGYEFAVAQGGSNVSGGQRQRLSIARALAVKPDIYLFDDSFSALDFKTDAALRKALADYTSNSTFIIVAQRVNTIMDADQIFVIDEGRIVGSGTHAELLKSCEAYYEIASSQLSERDLTRSTSTRKGGESHE